MARISGVTIPAKKQIWVSLTYIYGIGPKTSHDILSKAKIEPTIRVEKLNDAEISRIQEVINNDLIVEGELPKNCNR
jgi:small subunit ribosomal protein S13